LRSGNGHGRLEEEREIGQMSIQEQSSVGKKDSRKKLLSIIKVNMRKKTQNVNQKYQGKRTQGMKEVTGTIIWKR
jgi:hypothetical protein